VRTLKDVSLFDVSVVSFPAYAATSAQVRDYLTALSQADGADDAAKAGLQARSAARRRNIRLMEM
jgi:phage head maturation protease